MEVGAGFPRMGSKGREDAIRGTSRRLTSASRSCLALALVVALSGCAGGRRPQVPPAPRPPPEVRPEPEIPPAEPGPPPEVRRPPSRARIEAMPFPSSLPLPVDGVGISELTSSFDAPRDGGRRRHEAIDIFAPRNTPVRATTHGYVSSRGVRGLGGRTISVIGPAGYRHYYAHLEVWAGFERGDFVVPGDILGYVGNSGNARGGPTHLHYAIYTDGDEPLDPYPFLRRGPGSFE